MSEPRHRNEPYTCETPGENPIGDPKFIGTDVVYVSSSGREWDATVVSTHENPYVNPNGVTLPLVCLEFRNERDKIIRKHKVLPWGWAYWCSDKEFYSKVWKPKK